MALAASLLAVLLAAEPAAAAGPLDPPPTTDALFTGSLPLCSDTNLASGRSHQATDLGWGPGIPRGLVSYTEADNSVSKYEYAPQIPCRGGSGNTTILVPLMVHIFTLVGNNSHAIGNQTSTWVCWSGSAYSTTTAAGASITGANGTVAAGTDYSVQSGAFASGTLTTSTCKYLVSISYVINAGYVTDHVALTATWKPALWRTADSGWAAATSLTQFNGPSGELPIQCPLDTSGSDIVTVFSHFFASLASLPACLLIPTGWDRNGSLAAAWAQGTIGSVSTAFSAAIPSGIACGSVGTIPFFGTNISLNTCTADVAPESVKVVVGWVMVLGVAVLIARRILWVLGSRG